MQNFLKYVALGMLLTSPVVIGARAFARAQPICCDQAGVNCTACHTKECCFVGCDAGCGAGTAGNTACHTWCVSNFP